MSLLNLLKEVATPDEIDISELNIDNHEHEIVLSHPHMPTIRLTRDEAVDVYRKLRDAIDPTGSGDRKLSCEHGVMRAFDDARRLGWDGTGGPVAWMVGEIERLRNSKSSK